jgi:hypothetical protein
MPRLRWPTREEWALLAVMSAVAACIGFTLWVTYSGMERAQHNLEAAGHAQEREVPSDHR